MTEQKRSRQLGFPIRSDFSVAVANFLPQHRELPLPPYWYVVADRSISSVEPYVRTGWTVYSWPMFPPPGNTFFFHVHVLISRCAKEEENEDRFAHILDGYHDLHLFDDASAQDLVRSGKTSSAKAVFP
jgi:hypothetical protein